MTSGHSAQRTAWRRWILVWFWLLLPVLPGVAYAQSERTTGEWQQFVIVDDVWRSLGVYRVERSGSAYRMEPVSQSEDPGVTTSKGLSNVRFSGEDWRFNSDWGSGNVAEFRLRRAAPGIYLGWSYLSEERQNFNMWLLVR